jgi:hypothetical protein
MTKKALPKTVYVRWEVLDAGEAPFLIASATAADSVSGIGQAERVGIYELKEIVTVEGTIDVR